MRDTCPQCSQPANWSQENPWRPFCCERCKMSDLGGWMTERYSIPDESEPAPESGEGGEDYEPDNS